MIFPVAAVAWCAYIVFKFANFWYVGNVESRSLPVAWDATVYAFSEMQLSVVGGNLFALVLAAAIVFALSGPGELILWATGVRKIDPGGRFLYSAGLGIGAFSLVMLFVGLLGLLDKTLISILLGVSAAARVILTLKNIFTNGASDPDDNIATVDSTDNSLDIFDYLIAVCGVILIVLAWLFSSTPVWEIDSVLYHLALPKLYLAAERIYYVPYIVQANWPQLSEMMYMSGLSIGGEGPAKMMALVFGLFACGAMWRLGSLLGGRRAGLWAAAMLPAIPVAVKEVSRAGTDISMCFYSLLAVCALVEWDNGRRRVWLPAVFAGLAASCKLIGGPGIVILLICVAWRGFAHKKSPGAILKDCIVFSFFAFLPLAPWLARTYFWTGNPVWPFLYGIFGGANWSAVSARDYVQFVHQSYSYAEPWQLHVIASRITFIGFGGSIGVLPAILLPFAAAKLFKTRGIPVFYAIATGIAWIIISQQTRFLLPAIAVWIAISAAAASLTSFRKLGSVLSVVAMVTSVVVIWSFTSIEFNTALAGKGREVVRSRLQAYRISSTANKLLPEDAKVLLMWVSGCYYMERDCVWGDPVDQGMFQYCDYNSPADFQEELNRLGVTHVLFRMTGLQAKARFDREMRSRLGLQASEKTGVSCAASIENALITGGAWQEIFRSEDGSFFFFKVNYPEASD